MVSDSPSQPASQNGLSRPQNPTSSTSARSDSVRRWSKEETISMLEILRAHTGYGLRWDMLCRLQNQRHPPAVGETLRRPHGARKYMSKLVGSLRSPRRNERIDAVLARLRQGSYEEMPGVNPPASRETTPTKLTIMTPFHHLGESSSSETQQAPQAHIKHVTSPDSVDIIDIPRS